MSRSLLLFGVNGSIFFKMDGWTHKFNSTHYADPAVLADSLWSLDTVTLLEAFIGSTVEIFFAVRVWKCECQRSNNECVVLDYPSLVSNGALLGKVITALIMFLSVLHFSLGVCESAPSKFLDKANPSCSVYF